MDPFVWLAPLLLLPIVGLLRFIGCFDFSVFEVKSVEVQPATADLGPGDSQAFQAINHMGDGSTGVATDFDNWTPNAPLGVYTAPNPFNAAVVAATVTASDPSDATIGGSAQITLYPVMVSLTPPAPVLKMGEPQQFTQHISPTTVSQAVNWSPNAAGGAFVAPNALGVYTVSATSIQYPASAPGIATVTVIGNTAVLSGNNNPDIITQGNWSVNGVYGTKGYVLADVPDLSNLPSFLPALNISIEPAVGNVAPPGDPRYLLKPDQTRLAYAWQDPNTVSADIDFSDYQPHQVAVYFMDFGGTGVKLTVQMLDGDTPAKLLTTTNLANLNTTPVYLVWIVTGHVKMQVTKTAGSVALFSGIFFD